MNLHILWKLLQVISALFDSQSVGETLIYYGRRDDNDLSSVSVAEKDHRL